MKEHDSATSDRREARTEGRLAIVILPGLDGTVAFMTSVAERLAEHFDVRIVEFPASGPNDYATLLAHVRQSTADLPRFVTIGFSFSGPLAVMLLEAEPERVHALILAATFVRWPRPELRSCQVLLRTPTIWTIRLLRRLPRWLAGGRSDLRRAAQTVTWARVQARTIAQRVRAMAAVDVSHSLMRSSKPVLNVRVIADQAVPAENAFEIRRCCPHSETADVNGSHLSLLEHPGLLADPVLRFLTTLTVSPTGVSGTSSTPRASVGVREYAAGTQSNCFPSVTRGKGHAC